MYMRTSLYLGAPFVKTGHLKSPNSFGEGLVTPLPHPPTHPPTPKPAPWALCTVCNFQVACFSFFFYVRYAKAWSDYQMALSIQSHHQAALQGNLRWLHYCLLHLNMNLTVTHRNSLCLSNMIAHQSFLCDPVTWIFPRQWSSCH